MIRRLRSRPPIDTLPTDTRAERRSLGRRLYLAGLGVGVVTLVNILFGHLVFLRADGLVVREQLAVSATSLARLTAVHVREGDVVSAGDRLATVESADMIERMGVLSAREGELIAQLATLDVKTQSLEALLPVARDRAHQSAALVADYKRLRGRSLVTAASQDEAFESSFEASQALIDLEGELSALEQQVTAIANAKAETTKAIVRMRQHYADGEVRAPFEATVGADLPPPGLVVRPGDALMTLHYGSPHVVAFVPNDYLFGVTPGQVVDLHAGRAHSRARIEAILPYAEALPPEFQRIFRPRDRYRLVRLTIEELEAFPVLEKVRIRNCWLFCSMEGEAPGQAVDAGDAALRGATNTRPMASPDILKVRMNAT
ncbi:MAG: biotin/lipoyl-binding protein [Pseudomonadota bacterium]